MGYNGKKSFQRTFVKSECKIKVSFYFHQNKAYAEHLFAYLCEFFKDRCLVYFCTACYELSQFVFSIYYPRIYLKSVLSILYSNLFL